MFGIEVNYTEPIDWNIIHTDNMSYLKKREKAMEEVEEEAERARNKDQGIKVFD